MCDVISTRGVVKLHHKLFTEESTLLFDCGLFIDPLVKLHATLPAGKARALKDIVSNWVFCKADFFEFGYDIDPVCDKCNNAYDTLYHRCFTCIKVTQHAMEELGIELFNEVTTAGPHSLHATRLMVPHPVQTVPPSQELVCNFINMGPGDVFKASDGDLYGDGCCFNPKDPALSRAGFSVIQIDSHGQPFRGVFGLVPASMPQTSSR